MNTQIKNTQDILGAMENIFKAVDAIAASSKQLLGENHPIVISAEFAAVHLMNACNEIDDTLINDKGNFLETKTLAQILDVLTRIKLSGPENRSDLVEAYQIAGHDVANFNCVFRNTIVDACTRRLQLNRDGFLELVQQWLDGNPNRLKQVLKAHCEVSLQALINDFFSGHPCRPLKS